MEDDSETKGAGDGAPDSLLPYDQWLEDALRGVVARALGYAMREGLPGQHHFYITFRTAYPGVVLPPRLRQKYPDEMTIVLQHQFDALVVDDEAGQFGVSLSFGGILSPLMVPFAAITAFVDPFVQYRLQFRAPEPALPVPLPLPAPAAAAASPQPGGTPQVVSLDAFRRKRD